MSDRFKRLPTSIVVLVLVTLVTIDDFLRGWSNDSPSRTADITRRGNVDSADLGDIQIAVGQLPLSGLARSHGDAGADIPGTR